MVMVLLRFMLAQVVNCALENCLPADLFSQKIQQHWTHAFNSFEVKLVPALYLEQSWANSGSGNLSHSGSRNASRPRTLSRSLLQAFP